MRDTTSEALLFVSGAALLSAQMRAAAIYHRPFVQSDTVDLTVVAHYALAVGLLVQSEQQRFSGKNHNIWLSPVVAGGAFPNNFLCVEEVLPESYKAHTVAEVVIYLFFAWNNCQAIFFPPSRHFF